MVCISPTTESPARSRPTRAVQRRRWRWTSIARCCSCCVLLRTNPDPDECSIGDCTLVHPRRERSKPLPDRELGAVLASHSRLARRAYWHYGLNAGRSAIDWFQPPPHLTNLQQHRTGRHGGHLPRSTPETSRRLSSHITKSPDSPGRFTITGTCGN